MGVMFFTSEKIINADLYHFGPMTTFSNILKDIMSRYQNCMKWVIQETAVCIVVLGFISNQTDIIGIKN